MPELAALHHVRGQPARVDQPDPHRPGPRLRPRPRLRPARRTSSTWPSTSCATGSCCRSRRSPTTSRADDILTTILGRVPVPVVPTAGAVRTSTSAPERVLQRLDWQVIRRLDGLLQGDYRSLFRGNGVDFADLREYQPGDDVRYIDWNVTARMDTPYVREYHEDREITAWFLLDLSPSVDFGTVDDGPAEADRPDRLRDDAGPAADPPRQPGRRDLLRRPGRRARSRPRGGRVQVLRLDRRPARAAAPADARRSPTSTPLLDAGQQRDQAPLARRSSSPTSSASPAGSGRSTCSTGATRSSRSGSSTRARSTLPDVGPMIMEDAETGEQLYVDTARRRRSGGASEAAAAAARPSSRDAFRRAGVEAVSLSTDEDLVRAHRPDGDAPPRAGGSRAMTFLWPQLLLLARRSSRSGVAASTARIERRRRGRAAAAARAARRSRRPRRAARAGAGARRIPARPARRRASSSWSSRSPGRRRPSSAAAARGHGHPRLRRLGQHGRRPTSQPTRMDAAKAAATRLRRAPAAERRRSASSPSATRASRSRRRPTTRPTVLAAIDRLTPQRGHVARAAGSSRRSTRSPPAEAGPDRRLLQQPLARADRPRRRRSRRARTRSAVIVLLTDGENNERPDPVAAAQTAADRGRPDRTRSGSAAPPARRSTSTASRSTPSSTRRRSSRSPT